eukprot:TRINITY_DN11709_c0_g1_i1.p1 TRINITY_DN11709_c0_g1~~TRINITY_DN11709_c0_g1_i1.p1  ORF type:complete len:426 (+),score=86.06 TRINITY_DN11709_c0_g1_i1:99-1376(+)
MMKLTKRAFSTTSAIERLFGACPDMHNQVTNCFYGKVNLFIGPGAINKTSDIVTKYGIKKVGVVADPCYKVCGAWGPMEAAFKKHGVEVTLFDKFKPNPSTSDVDECVTLFRDRKVDHIFAIGGGSAIDGAKSASLLIPNQGTASELYDQKLNHLSKHIPLIAVNTTAGTGTEVDHFAVCTIEERKPAAVKPVLDHFSIYPVCSIDDCELTYGLPTKQTAFTYIDACNHVMEAVSTRIANPFAVIQGRAVYEIAAKYLPMALQNPKSREARYWLMWGAMLGGASFDSCGLHLTHALEHPMSALKPLTIHGQGLAAIQPNVLKFIYPHRAKTLSYVMNPIFSRNQQLRGSKSEAIVAAVQLEAWLKKMGVPEKLSDLGFPTVQDCEALTENVYSSPYLPALVGLAPTDVDRNAVLGIYKEALKRLA